MTIYGIFSQENCFTLKDFWLGRNVKYKQKKNEQSMLPVKKNLTKKNKNKTKKTKMNENLNKPFQRNL